MHCVVKPSEKKNTCLHFAKALSTHRTFRLSIICYIFTPAHIRRSVCSVILRRFHDNDNRLVRILHASHVPASVPVFNLSWHPFSKRAIRLLFIERSTAIAERHSCQSVNALLAHNEESGAWVLSLISLLLSRSLLFLLLLDACNEQWARELLRCRVD